MRLRVVVEHCGFGLKILNLSKCFTPCGAQTSRSESESADFHDFASAPARHNNPEPNMQRDLRVDPPGSGLLPSSAARSDDADAELQKELEAGQLEAEAIVQQRFLPVGGPKPSPPTLPKPSTAHVDAKKQLFGRGSSSKVIQPGSSRGRLPVGMPPGSCAPPSANEAKASSSPAVMVPDPPAPPVPPPPSPAVASGNAAAAAAPLKRSGTMPPAKPARSNSLRTLKRAMTNITAASRFARAVHNPQQEAFLRAKDLTRMLGAKGQEHSGLGTKTELDGSEFGYVRELFRLSRLGKADELRPLLAQLGAAHPALQARDYSGRSLLLTAAREGHIDVVEALIASGLDPNTPVRRMLWSSIP